MPRSEVYENLRLRLAGERMSHREALSGLEIRTPKN